MHAWFTLQNVFISKVRGRSKKLSYARFFALCLHPSARMLFIRPSRRLPVRPSVRPSVDLFTHKQAQAETHTHIYIYIYIYIHTRTHTYTQTSLVVQLVFGTLIRPSVIRRSVHVSCIAPSVCSGCS